MKKINVIFWIIFAITQIASIAIFIACFNILPWDNNWYDYVCGNDLPAGVFNLLLRSIVLAILLLIIWLLVNKVVKRLNTRR